MNKVRKVAVLLSSIAVIIGSVCVINCSPKNLQKAEMYNIKAYTHNPNNILENVFVDQNNSIILPFIFDKYDQTIPKDFLMEQFRVIGLTVENESELGDIIVTGDIIRTDSLTITVLIYGDVNADGMVDTRDAQRILRHYVYGGKYELNGIFAKAGNLNNADDEIDTRDAQRALRFYVYEKTLLVKEPEVLGLAKKVTREELIDDLVITDYTTGSWDDLEAAIAVALTKKLAPEYNEALVDVNTAKTALVPADFAKAANKAEILATLTDSTGSPLVEDEYTVESWNELEEKIQEALKQILESKYNAALQEVNEAKNNLRKIPELPTDLTAVYGTLLSTITLPDGWEFDTIDNNAKVGDVGNRGHNVVYTPRDLYSTVQIKVTPADLPETSYTVPTIQKEILSDTLLSDVTLPQGWSFDSKYDSTRTVGVPNLLGNEFDIVYDSGDTNYNKAKAKLKIKVISNELEFTLSTENEDRYCYDVIEIIASVGDNKVDLNTLNVTWKIMDSSQNIVNDSSIVEMIDDQEIIDRKTIKAKFIAKEEGQYYTFVPEVVHGSNVGEFAGNFIEKTIDVKITDNKVADRITFSTTSAINLKANDTNSYAKVAVTFKHEYDYKGRTIEKEINLNAAKVRELLNITGPAEGANNQIVVTLYTTTENGSDKKINESTDTNLPVTKLEIQAINESSTIYTATYTYKLTLSNKAQLNINVTPEKVELIKLSDSGVNPSEINLYTGTLATTGMQTYNGDKVYYDGNNIYTILPIYIYDGETRYDDKILASDFGIDDINTYKIYVLTQKIQTVIPTIENIITFDSQENLITSGNVSYIGIALKKMPNQDVAGTIKDIIIYNEKMKTKQIPIKLDVNVIDTSTIG